MDHDRAGAVILALIGTAAVLALLVVLAAHGGIIEPIHR